MSCVSGVKKYISDQEHVRLKKNVVAIGLAHSKSASVKFELRMYDGESGAAVRGRRRRYPETNFSTIA